MQVVIHPQPFSPWQEIDAWSRSAAAMSVFMGRVRGIAMDGGDLEVLELEHYAGLCERCIESSAHHLLIEHDAAAALVLHRVGRLTPGDLIVLVAVEADRRGSAQRCGAALLEALKYAAAHCSFPHGAVVVACGVGNQFDWRACVDGLVADAPSDDDEA